jgi:phosphopantothenoylcysteine decarboxylase/phosphopantothenate--cysteine ligase
LGAQVTLVAGPVSWATPAGVERRIDITTALELQAVLTELVAGDVDAVVMAAAVADFRPAEAVRGKLSRRDQATTSLALTPNPDVLAGLGAARQGLHPLLVGFSAEVGLTGPALIARAHAKLKEKRCDVIIANDVSAPGLGFASDDNAVVIINQNGEGTALGPLPKTLLAERIWAVLTPILSLAHESPSARKP